MQVKAVTLKFVSFSSSNAQSIFFPTNVMAVLLIGCFIMRLRNQKPSCTSSNLGKKQPLSLTGTFIFSWGLRLHSLTNRHALSYFFFGGGSSSPYPIRRRLVITVVKTRGTFHSSKTSVLNFLQLPVVNSTAFSKISEKEDNLTKYTKIFKGFFLGSFLSIQLCSQNF